MRYRYYVCWKHQKFKSCNSMFKTVPASGPVEEQVVNKIIRILKSPEVVMSLNRLAERRKDVSKADLMTAIKNLNEVWNFLYQAEQRKIIHMLINKIVIQENGIKIDLNLEDFESLIMQLV